MTGGVALPRAAPFLLGQSNRSVHRKTTHSRLGPWLFVKDLAVEKLHEFLRSEQAHKKASVAPGMSALCGAHFTVVFGNKHDAGNRDYRSLRRRQIALDCRLGLHEDVYVLGDQ
jgi:hypothetical protein